MGVSSVLLFLLIAVSIGVQAQEGTRIARLDSSLDDIVAPDAKIEKVSGDFGHLQGVVWARRGKFVCFGDNSRNTLYKLTPDGKVSVLLEHADQGFASDGVSRLGGPNGMTLDLEGHIMYGTRIDHAVVRLDPGAKRVVMVSQYESKNLKAINGMVYKKDGALYFTDTTWGIAERREAGLPEEKWETPPGLYLLKDGKLQLLAAKVPSPSGIALSPDEKYLYYSDNNKKIMRYDVLPDDTVANGELFIDRSTDKARGASDDLKIDQKGNLYSPGPGGIWIISPAGKHLGTLKVADTAAHLAFGDEDGMSLYVTSAVDLYRIRVKIPGVRP